MKKLLVVFSVAVLLCGFAMSSNQFTSQASAYTFGSTYMTLNNPGFVAMNDGIRAKVEADGHKLITYDPALDQAKQINQIEDLIAQKVDLIFLNPVDWQGVKPALEACKAAGIPVINLDAPVYDADLVVSIIASDNYQAGVLCAQAMMKDIPEAKIAILEHPTAKSAADRIVGFEATIKDNPKYQIVARQSSEGQLELAMPAMENIIQAHPDLDVVMCLNDPTALGAIAALKSANMLEQVLVYGVDGHPDGKKAIKSGEMKATAAQTLVGIGQIGVDEAYKVLKGEKIEHDIAVPVTLITVDNVDQFGTDKWQ